MDTRDSVIKHIFELLLSGKVDLGAKLPSSQVLAKKGGVSIPTARESIKHLETIGIVDVIHGKGIFSTKGKGLIDDLFEAREFFECNNVEVAARKSTKIYLSKFGNILEKMTSQAQKKNTNGYFKSHYDFHYHIALQTENRILIKAYENIQRLFSFQVEVLNMYPEVINLSEHYVIFDHIKNRKPLLAKSAMKQHIKASSERWKKYIKNFRFSSTI